MTQPTPARRFSGLLWIAAAGLLSGCETKSWFDPSEVGRFDRQPLVMPILPTLDVGVEEPRVDFLNAQNATSEDLLARRDDYRIQRGDLITVSITDLYAPGVETIKTARVSESGRISLPYIGQVMAMDTTESDLEGSIAKSYADANIITRAQVSVTVAEARGKVFSILGGVGNQGQYAIVNSDFRVLDALVLGGNVSSPFIKELYIIRPLRQTPAPAGQSPAAPRPQAAPSETDLAPRTQADAPKVAYLQETSAPPADGGERYIIIDGKPVLVPSDQAEAAETAPAPESPAPAADQTPAPQPGADQPTTPETQAQQAVPEQPATQTAAPAQPAGSQPFEFSVEPPSSGASRVIRVDLEALRQGDLRQNVVIKPNDMVFVPAPPSGVYYMGGHVNRAGVFALAGQDVTLKQAVIAAGMLDGLAIPERTDVIRRIGKDREVYARVDLNKIFEGAAPDILLKADDQIIVGTNALAPFLATFRGAFRFTYGFGFIYDKNFADNNDNFVN